MGWPLVSEKKKKKKKAANQQQLFFLFFFFLRDRASHTHTRTHTHAQAQATYLRNFGISGFRDFEFLSQGSFVRFVGCLLGWLVGCPNKEEKASGVGWLVAGERTSCTAVGSATAKIKSWFAHVTVTLAEGGSRRCAHCVTVRPPKKNPAKTTHQQHHVTEPGERDRG